MHQVKGSFCSVWAVVVLLTLIDCPQVLCWQSVPLEKGRGFDPRLGDQWPAWPTNGLAFYTALLLRGFDSPPDLDKETVTLKPQSCDRDRLKGSDIAKPWALPVRARGAAAAVVGLSSCVRVLSPLTQVRAVQHFICSSCGFKMSAPIVVAASVLVCRNFIKRQWEMEIKRALCPRALPCSSLPCHAFSCHLWVFSIWIHFLTIIFERSANFICQQLQFLNLSLCLAGWINLFHLSVTVSVGSSVWIHLSSPSLSYNLSFSPFSRLSRLLPITGHSPLWGVWPVGPPGCVHHSGREKSFFPSRLRCSRAVCSRCCLLWCCCLHRRVTVATLLCVAFGFSHSSSFLLHLVISLLPLRASSCFRLFRVTACSS